MKRSFQIDRRRENNLWKVNNIKERERVSKQRDYLTTSDATARSRERRMEGPKLSSN